MKSVWGFRCGVDIKTENGGKGKIRIFLHHKRFFRFFPPGNVQVLSVSCEIRYLTYLF